MDRETERGFMPEDIHPLLARYHFQGREDVDEPERGV